MLSKSLLLSLHVVINACPVLDLILLALLYMALCVLCFRSDCMVKLWCYYSGCCTHNGTLCDNDTHYYTLWQ